MANKKTPNPDDVAIGKRVRAFRQQASMSQEKLGLALGLTFQQVQKYEKGMNRIGGSRMLQIAKVLGVPGGVLLGEAPLGMGEELEVLTMADTSGARKLLNFYNLIADPRAKFTVLMLAETLAEFKGKPKRKPG